MHKVNCEIEILTPMFLGGSSQTSGGTPICELRSQSIKGVLRYWYRTLVGYDNIAEKESRLFGSSDEKVGKSKVQILIEDKSNLKSIHINPKSSFSLNSNDLIIEEEISVHGERRKIKVNPLDYLGYGAVDRKKIIRGYFDADKRFKLRFKLIGCDAEQRKEFFQSIWLWVTFGGLGSRSRKGFGALTLLNEDEVFEKQNWFVKGNISETLKNIIDNKSPIESESLYNKKYSYLDTDTKLWFLNKDAATWNECLSMLGKDYHTWRQVLAIKDGRENLGTPLLHGNDQVKNKRRASSYFLTIFKYDAEKYKYGVLHIPSNYSVDIHIPQNLQREYHRKFQAAIEKTSKREV